MNTNKNTQSVTLQCAVLMQVESFVKNIEAFSIHDITRRIRKLTSQGELEIPEVMVSGASFKMDIPHYKVKQIFEDLWSSNSFNQPDFDINRKFNGVYFEYTPSGALNPSTTPVFTTSVVTPSSSSSTTTTNTVGNPPYVSQNNAARIQIYLSNCAKKNFRPTLKQIQSAIKRDDVPCCSCGELKLYITALGYSIVDNPDAVSKSQVVL